MWVRRKVSSSNRAAAPSEVRDPRAATVTGTSVSRWQGGHTLWDAGSAVTDAYYSNVYVYACARARAQDMSSLPLRFGADPEKPKDFDLKHPLAKLLGPAPGGPTMNISARRLIAWGLTQYDVTGRMAWEIASPVGVRRDGAPFELWPIPAQLITPIPTESGADWFKEFQYQTKNGLRRTIPRDDLLYHWRPSQNDFREPESLLQAARLNVSIAIMQDRYDYAFLVNDARPAAVVVHEEFQVKKERDSFRRQFLDSHRGPDNAGKVAFVEASRDGSMPKDALLIQQLGLSQRDAEFINRMENEIRAICVAMATPLSRLADSSRRTYSNAEVEAKNYWRTAIHPCSIEFAEAINIQLMPRVGDSSNVCWFDTTGVPELEPNKRFAVGDIPELLNAEVINRNEARTSIELAEIGPEGDVFGELPSSDSLAANDPASEHATEPRALPSGVPVFRSLEDGTLAAIPVLVRNWNTDLRRLYAQQTESLVKRVAGKRGRQAGDDLPGVFDRTFWYDKALERTASLLHMTYLVACTTVRATGQLVAFDESSPECMGWVTKHAGVRSARFVDDIESVLRCADHTTVETLLVASTVEVDYSDMEHVLRSAITTATIGTTAVSARVAADALVLLARGDLSLEDAIACLA